MSANLQNDKRRDKQIRRQIKKNTSVLSKRQRHEIAAYERRSARARNIRTKYRDYFRNTFYVIKTAFLNKDDGYADFLETYAESYLTAYNRILTYHHDVSRKANLYELNKAYRLTAKTELFGFLSKIIENYRKNPKNVYQNAFIQGHSNILALLDCGYKLNYRKLKKNFLQLTLKAADYAVRFGASFESVANKRFLCNYISHANPANPEQLSYTQLKSAIILCVNKNALEEKKRRLFPFIPSLKSGLDSGVSVAFASQDTPQATETAPAKTGAPAAAYALIPLALVFTALMSGVTADFSAETITNRINSALRGMLAEAGNSGAAGASGYSIARAFDETEAFGEPRTAETPNGQGEPNEGGAAGETEASVAPGITGTANPLDELGEAGAEAASEAAAEAGFDSANPAGGGAAGEQSTPADQSPAGTQGEQSNPADQSPAGTQGEQSAPAEQSPAGTQGEQNNPAEQSPAGTQGEQSTPNEQSPSGAQGEQSAPADQSPAGTQGEQSNPNEQSPAGTQGEQSTPNEQSPAGTQGEQNNPAEQSPAGTQGEQSTPNELAENEQNTPPNTPNTQPQTRNTPAAGGYASIPISTPRIIQRSMPPLAGSVTREGAPKLNPKTGGF